MSKLTHFVVAVAGLTVLPGFLHARPMDSCSISLTPGAPGSGELTVNWSWSTMANTNANINVYEYLGPNPDGSPKLGTRVYSMSQTGYSGTNPTPAPKPSGTSSGKQYIAKIELVRSTVVKSDQTIAVTAP